MYESGIAANAHRYSAAEFVLLRRDSRRRMGHLGRNDVSRVLAYRRSDVVFGQATPGSAETKADVDAEIPAM